MKVQKKCGASGLIDLFKKFEDVDIGAILAFYEEIFGEELPEDKSIMEASVEIIPVINLTFMGSENPPPPPEDQTEPEAITGEIV